MDSKIEVLMYDDFDGPLQGIQYLHDHGIEFISKVFVDRQKELNNTKKTYILAAIEIEETDMVYLKLKYPAVILKEV